MKWKNVNDLMPNDDTSEPEKEYHLVYVKGYGSMKAMYMDGEWWKDYTGVRMEVDGPCDVGVIENEIHDCLDLRL